MLAIRLQRIGKKHQPSFRLVVAERRSKLGAPPVEDLGSYNPFTKKFEVKKEKIEHWVNVGAKPSVSVHNLLVSAGVLKASKMAVKMAKPVPKTEAPAEAASAPAADAPAGESPAA